MITVIDGALARARTIIMILLLLLVAGAITYVGIPKESDPDIEVPFLYVSIHHEGISPEDAERLLLRPMEQELKGIEGIKEMKSTAVESHGSITMEFNVGINVKQALADVREKVSLAKAKLPDGTDEPTVNEVTFASMNPALTVLISGSAPERALVAIGRDLQDKIEGMREVLEVKLQGDREDMVEILVDPLLLESYNLDTGDIFQLVSRNNQLVAAGTMDTGVGRFPVKVPSVFNNIRDVMSLPIKVDGDKVVTFADVATIRRTFKDPESFARVNGQPTLALEIVKRPGENIISTAEKVRALVAKESEWWPNSIKVDFAGDQSKDVKNMLGELQANVMSAIVLVVIVIIAILGVRSAALVGISIPGSFLTGILVLALFGMTINIVVMFALIMAVGMLVDGAIVVTEYADREMSEGMGKKQAYKLAAQRMAWPITASTATTLAAFAPLLFWPGIMGQFMQYLPLTLIATLTASLFMALVFVPTLGGIFGKARPVSVKTQQSMLQAEGGDILSLPGFTGKYVRFLNAAIKRPVMVLIGAIIFSVAVMFAYGSSHLGVNFFPQMEPVGFNIKVRSFGDLSIYEKDALMAEIEEQVLGMEDIETLVVKTGSVEGNTDLIGTFRVNLFEWNQRRKADEVIADIYQKTAHIAGVDIVIKKDQNGPPSEKDLEIEISSRFSELLDPAAKLLRQKLQQSGKFINIEDNGPKPGIEWLINVDRADAARFGADAALVGSSVQFITSGLKLGEYRPDDVDDELDIRVRFPEDKRSLTRLDELRIKTAVGQVPISNFVEIEAGQKQATIHKVDGKKSITVGADMAGDENLSLVLPKLKEELAKLSIDPRIDVKIRGQNEDQDEASAFLSKAFMVALSVMAIILVTQFNSFYQAGLILSAVLFSTVGVFLGLLIAQRPFGIVMSGIGVIALAGIVVNNNIVLIDTYNHLRSKGMDAVEAILRTGAQRLRPVLMTTVTTILGLMPMVLEVNIDLLSRLIEFGAPTTQMWSQLSTAIAGGLAFATILTLVLTPCLLMLGTKLHRLMGKQPYKPLAETT
ncbi:efflux RND transporter permease subunit [Motilimonas pumila]|uniref:Efflux RND transporter permease subunit n=1 Tax=Motilimonas pumila TaxID=2303987 RepID=A0A418YC46_9GAMM|nr:efflux RND transporter permease subunit [Motilimonas pumila]RJG42088.1 efflux RND transporter permease subunit [Motilimonas pumila]